MKSIIASMAAAFSRTVPRFGTRSCLSETAAWRKRAAAIIGALSMMAAPWPAVAEAVENHPLAATFQAHGGLDAWRAQRAFTYTLNGFPLTQQVAKANHSTVDLRTRNNRIEGPGFTVGFDGHRAWVVPGPEAVGLPPRFFALGSFYFIGMPFVFADPGVIAESQYKAEFLGKKYDVVRIRYETGVGHTAEDDYVLFIDPDTHRLKLIHHSVTEDPKVERVTWVFNEWQRVSGLLIPKRMTFYPGWNSGNDPGEGAEFSIENARFHQTPPDPSIYTVPAELLQPPVNSMK